MKRANRFQPWRDRTAFAVGFGIVALVGVGMTVGGHMSAAEYQREYLALPRGSDFAAVKNRRDAALVIRNIGIPCFAIGAADFALSLAIW
jgi:hypothetical protein